MFEQGGNALDNLAQIIKYLAAHRLRGPLLLLRVVAVQPPVLGVEGRAQVQRGREAPPHHLQLVGARPQPLRGHRRVALGHVASMKNQTEIVSQIRPKLRDWAVWQAQAGCYS